VLRIDRAEQLLRTKREAGVLRRRGDLGRRLRMPMTSSTLGRRVCCEFLGTALLMTAVVGSGIAAQRLSPNDIGLQLLENALITGAALVALILALQPVSAAFNPIVTLAERVLGSIGTGDAAKFVAAQIAGGIGGTVLANLMFRLPAVTIAHHQRSGANLWLAEVVASFGLLLVIFGVARTGRSDRVAVAVGAYIAAAYWFTSSTSFANPAATIGRIFSNTFAGIAPGSVGAFIAAELIGGALAVAVIRYLFPAQQIAASLLIDVDEETAA